jgi:antitoxin StbD
VTRTATLAELKKDPLGIVASGGGEAIEITEGPEIIFFCVPAKLFEEMMDRIEDAELNEIADAREGQPAHKVNLADL